MRRSFPPEARISCEVLLEIYYDCSWLLTTFAQWKLSLVAGLKVGSEVSFTAKIEVVKCPKDPRDWTQTFQVLLNSGPFLRSRIYIETIIIGTPPPLGVENVKFRKILKTLFRALGAP